MDITFRQMLDSASYEREKEKLRQEMNWGALPIDHTVFEKTDAEKTLLYNLKLSAPKHKPKSIGRYEF